MRRFLIVVTLLLVGLWLRSAFFAVDAAEFVYVTRFGHVEAIHDGGTNAGLHIKAPWPVDSVLRMDRRVQSFDLPAVEALTRDPATRTVDKTLAVDAFVTWKIPDTEAADRFVKTVRTPEQAKKILGPLINGRLAAVISTMPIEDLIGVTDTQTTLAAITGGQGAALPESSFRSDDSRLIDERNERVRRRLLGSESLHGGPANPVDDIRTKALSEYGIQVIDIRVRRFSYPDTVRGSIAERIRSERAKKVADYESDGRKRAADITTDADRAARIIEADAKAQKTVIEGQANAEAARIRAAAYAQDREFYLFLEQLRSFQAMLSDTRDVLLLTTKHPLLRIIQGPPTPAQAPPPK
ncbi:Modulator of FtsH protease HflC [Gemmata sp. SH-PL17]|uniref:protease modulator HflC n=1 Tax=Gemmata sp. SH-PL17 TaxID=1630693 RepID=UPI0004BA309A|nr:protease modulator HflC [Gemmata sp. SH-PL17]AMV23826.1 Modulator of FtsH protease HflC [Gemmata sp. SH-PL17]